jgi:hypothetical protein
MPRFSILVAYHQGSVSYAEYLRGIDSLLTQTYRDYEILAYHDGPLLDDTLDFKVPLTPTEVQYGDWGNSLRDRGIREASGDYLVHFNVDNYLYPNALEEIAREIDRQPRLFGSNDEVKDPNNIVIFPILYRGWQVNSGVQYLRKDHPEFFTIFTGIPPAPGNIDSMQLVMRRDLWLAEGGYYDKSPNGDGIMYQKFAEKYGYRTVSMPLGEHF